MAFDERGQFLHFPRHEDVPIEVMRVFDCCKAGDFSQCNSLVGLFDPEMALSSAFSALTLIAYSTPLSVQLQMAQDIRARLLGDSTLIQHLCVSLAVSGMLDSAEVALEIFLEDVMGEPESGFPNALSISFETSRSDLFFGPQPLSETIDEYDPDAARPDRDGYRVLVHRVFDHLSARYNSASRIAFREGTPVCLDAISHRLLMVLPKCYDNEEIVTARALIEASTGFDLADFFRRGMLDRSSAAIAIERLFENVDLQSFQPGKRYFFGHLIPD